MEDREKMSKTRKKNQTYPPGWDEMRVRKLAEYYDNQTLKMRPTSALAKSIAFTEDMMNVHLMDGRIIGVPIAWFPRLLAATPKQRKKYEIGGSIGLHWPELDEDLSVVGLMAGRIGRQRESSLVYYAMPCILIEALLKE